jgi:hypothetical protein
MYHFPYRREESTAETDDRWSSRSVGLRLESSPDGSKPYYFPDPVANRRYVNFLLGVATRFG